jgi:prevent-host-death family protein
MLGETEGWSKLDQLDQPGEQAQTNLMQTSMNLYEAKTQLSKLVDRAAAGEEIIIAKAGKPMARLVALEPKKRRPLEELMGKNLGGITYISPDFDAEDPELTALFENGDSPTDPLGK